MKVLLVVLIVVGLFVGGAAAWGAGELHYRNCLTTTAALHPAPVLSELDFIRVKIEKRQAAQRARVAAARACSRLP